MYRTADLCDVAPFPIALDGRIRPMWRGARIAGRALTVRIPPGQHPAVKRAAGELTSGDVLVVDGGGSMHCALWGDVLSQVALDRGAAGVVIDGAVRDLDEIESLAFPVFAAGASPVPPRRDREGTIGEPISCGGMIVRNGDYVYGDADGVVVVPAELHEGLVQQLNGAT